MSSIRLTVRCVNAATGWELSLDEAMIIGKRLVDLMCIFNRHWGITAGLKAPPELYGGAPVDGPVQGISVKGIWDNIKKRYYELMGFRYRPPLGGYLRAAGAGPDTRKEAKMPDVIEGMDM